MDNNTTVITDVPATCHIPYHHHKFSWAAIFAGAFTAVGLGFLLQLFGVAINLSAYHAASAGAQTIAIGGFLGLLIGVLASMIVAGYVAGYLGKFHCPHHHHAGAIYGFATWSLALLLSAVLIMPLSHYVNSWNHILAPEATASEMTAQNHETMMGTESDKTDADKKTKAETPLSKVTPTTLTGSAWMLFILFFLGAFASCVGGCIGMGCCRKSCHHHV